MHTHSRTYTQVHTHIYIRTGIHTCIHTYTNTYTRHTYIYIHTSPCYIVSFRDPDNCITTGKLWS